MHNGFLKRPPDHRHSPSEVSLGSLSSQGGGSARDEASLSQMEEDSDDDLLIESGHLIVDISNLIGTNDVVSRGSSVASMSWNSRNRKKRLSHNIYPTAGQLSLVQEVSVADLWTKSVLHKKMMSNGNQHMEKLPSAFGSSGKAGSGARTGGTMPGAFNCTPSSASVVDYYGTTTTDYMRGNDYHCSNDQSYGGNSSYGDHQQTSLEIEISPGIMAPLRGSKETWSAIQGGFSTNVDCFSCMAALVCIADADYVLCPECRVVSPTCVVERKLSTIDHRGGVGLGLKAQPMPPARASADYY